jgi:hypothetical protein
MAGFNGENVTSVFFHNCPGIWRENGPGNHKYFHNLSYHIFAQKCFGVFGSASLLYCNLMFLDAHRHHRHHLPMV